MKDKTPTNPPRSQEAFIICVFLCSAVVLAYAGSMAADISSMPSVLSAAAQYHAGQSLEALRQLEEWARQPNPALRSKVEAGLVELLSTNSSFEARRFACKELGIMGSTKALPALAGMLNRNDTAGIACLALTSYPPGKADDILRHALEQLWRGKHRRSQGAEAGEDQAVLRTEVQLIDTLGDRRDNHALKLLATIVRKTEDGTEKEHAICEAAVAALGKLGNRAAYDIIVPLCGCADTSIERSLNEVKLRCAENFARSGNPKLARAIYTELANRNQPACLRRGAFLGLLRLVPEGGEEQIVQVLHAEDSVLEPVAIAAVRSLPSREASERLARELPGLSTPAQAWLLESLAARGDDAARTALEQSLSSNEMEVRRAAISGLARAGAPGSVPPLAKVLEASTDAQEVQITEATLIDLQGGPETDAAILAELKRARGGPGARLVTVESRRLGAAANSALLEILAQGDPEMAKEACRMLARTAQVGDLPGILAAFDHLKDGVCRAEAERCASLVLARIDSGANRIAVVEPALERAGSVEDRIALLRLLPVCGDDKSLALLRTGARDDDARVRQVALEALADWPNLGAWGALAEIVRSAQDESSRRIALRGLARLAEDANAHPDGKLMERYEQLLKESRGDGDLKLVLSSLGGAADPKALDLALPLLSNPNVRPEAVVAVKKIAHAIQSKYPEQAQNALRQIDEAKP